MAPSTFLSVLMASALMDGGHAFSANSISTTFRSRNIHPLHAEKDDDEPKFDAAQMEWLRQRSEGIESEEEKLARAEAELEAAENIAGNVNIPKTGISVNDEMIDLQNTEKFVTQLFPLERTSVAALQTVTTETASDEPMRYLVPFDDYSQDEDSEEVEGDEITKRFAMIDLPPFSTELVSQMKAFMGEKGDLSHILITCRNGIHYDEAPAVYVTRRSDMLQWKKAFPTVKIVMYRLDASKDTKVALSQCLDGYGPWALDENGEFKETGRPLTVLEWDEETQAKVLDDGEMPPDDEEVDDDELYTPKAIKEREEGKDILAIYTPGHTYGSISYIFPKSRVCCSGFTIPVEDTRAGSAGSIAGVPTGAGPRLDYSGYLTTNTGGLDRQIESARHLASVYTDRFDVLLPSRGPPVSLGSYDANGRSRVLHDMLDEFAEVGRVYSSLGIL